MEITCKLKSLLPEQSGVSQRTGNTWYKRQFVVDYDDGWRSRPVAFSILGREKIDALIAIPVNSMVKVLFYPESREFSNRWYTDLNCSKVELLQSTTDVQTHVLLSPSEPALQQYAPTMPNDEDDLPFF